MEKLDNLSRLIAKITSDLISLTHSLYESENIINKKFSLKRKKQKKLRNRKNKNKKNKRVKKKQKKYIASFEVKYSKKYNKIFSLNSFDYFFVPKNYTNNEYEKYIVKPKVTNFFIKQNSEKLPERLLQQDILYNTKMEMTKYDEGLNIINVEYKNPIFFNRQWIYQRITIKVTEDTSVYELTVKAFKKAGIQVEAKYDEKFDSTIITSIDGKRDGKGKTYWEFWTLDNNLNTYEIGELPVNEQKIKKDTVLEWRDATEQESSCGGGSNYNSNYNNNAPNPYNILNDGYSDVNFLGYPKFYKRVNAAAITPLSALI